MSTYMAKANEIEKKWYIIDAAGKPLGRVAATAATILPESIVRSILRVLIAVNL